MRSLRGILGLLCLSLTTTLAFPATSNSPSHTTSDLSKDSQLLPRVRAVLPPYTIPGASTTDPLNWEIKVPAGSTHHLTWDITNSLRKAQGKLPLPRFVSWYMNRPTKTTTIWVSQITIGQMTKIMGEWDIQDVKQLRGNVGFPSEPTKKEIKKLPDELAPPYETPPARGAGTPSWRWYARRRPDVVLYVFSLYTLILAVLVSSHNLFPDIENNWGC